MSIPPTLLLADDSLAIQRVVSLTFADQPVRVVVAKDGQDAINRMSKDRPDLVLADTNMPCVDGYELARWVRQQPHLSAVPVLLLAGANDPVDEQRLHDSGANGVLEKPFEPSHVISRVKELLGIKGTPPAGTTRLVTAPEARPTVAPAPAATPTRKSSGSRPVASASAERHETPAAQPPVPSPQPHGEPPPAVAGQDDMGAPRGDARDWFGGVDSPTPMGVPSLAEELGVSAVRFYGQSEDVPSASGLDADFPQSSAGREVAPSRSAAAGAGSSAADVFESLLAVEQGDAKGPVVVRTAAAELTPEMLDYLAARVVERLRPGTLRDELQRGLGVGLREAVADNVREAVASETRAAVAEAVQAAVNGTILGTIRGSVNEAVASALPAAVEQHAGGRAEQAVADAVPRALREALGPLVQQAVRDVVEPAVRSAVADAVAAAVPAAVLDAVRGDAGGQVREIVHDTADRLIREEIAKIRERRG